MNKKSFLFICMVLLGLNSCDNFLTQEPISDLTSDKFLKSATDAEVGVVSIYNAFAKAMSPGMWNWGELRSDNFIPHEKGAEDQKEMIYNNIQTDNAAAYWTDLYTTIGRSNLAIKYIPRINMTSSIKNNLLGEAYAMRAWAYFYCVRVWGDVPLYTEPIESVEQDIYRERTEQSIVLNQILTDLEQAYLLIDKTSNERTRMNVGTICALMMDVQAWMHNYDMVIKIKEEKVNSLPAARWGLTALAASTFQKDWRDMFIENTTVQTPNEVLFKLAYDQLGNGENMAISYFASTQPRVMPAAILRAKYSTNDKRGQNIQWEQMDAVEVHLNRKFWANGTVFSGTGKIYSENDLIQYRYADIVLLYAEALCMENKTADAVTELNRTRVRAGESAFFATDFLSSDELLDAILDERQKEFVGEGKRWFDLVRTNRWQKVMEPINGMNDAKKVFFPIHRDHLNQNKKLVQNEGY